MRSGKTDASGDVLPPTDWDDPNPIQFIDVRPDVCFLVIIEGSKEWREMAMQILISALSNEGIGAKTSSGYGRMENWPMKKCTFLKPEPDIYNALKEILADEISEKDWWGEWKQKFPEEGRMLKIYDEISKMDNPEDRKSASNCLINKQKEILKKWRNKAEKKEYVTNLYCWAEKTL